jgi:hypothetical protein
MPRVDLGRVQHVVDVAKQQALRALDALEVVALVRGALPMNAELHQVRVTGDGIQGLAQLMADVRQEVGLGAIRLFGGVPGFFRQMRPFREIIVRAPHRGDDLFQLRV